MCRNVMPANYLIELEIREEYVVEPSPNGFFTRVRYFSFC